MVSNNKEIVEVPAKELKKILKAYNTIGSFLEHYVKPELLYREEFVKGMKKALSEVLEKKTKRVENFEDFKS